MAAARENRKDSSPASNASIHTFSPFTPRNGRATRESRRYAFAGDRKFP
jgi:hypothetical protein